MKTLITAITLLIFFQSEAQVPTQPVPPSIEKEASRIVDVYNDQLVLTSVQLPLFRTKVEDYLVLAEEIKANLDGKEELDALLTMQTKETLQMKNILTQQQLKLYEKMKPTVQPLKTVD